MASLQEPLDPQYVSRTSDFFTIGKTFSTLITEPRKSPGNDAANTTTVRFGELVHTRIARFVVVQRGRGFVYGCEIQTYGGRGTLRKGCNAEEHSAVYMKGDQPVLMPGEVLAKKAIEIVPATPDIGSLSRASRIRFGRGVPIQCDVKAKDIGHVREDHVPVLVSYWRREMGMDSGKQDHDELPTGSDRATDVENYVCPGPSTLDDAEKGRVAPDTYSSEIADEYGMRPQDHKSQLVPQAHTSPNTHVTPAPRRDIIRSAGLEYVMISEVGGELHSGFETINKPRGFFKKGRIFMVLLPQPAGSPETERTVYWKIRRFIVVWPRQSHCLCVPVGTYNGKATTKPGVVAQDHAPIIAAGSEARLHPDEEALQKAPLIMKVENLGVFLDPLSRVNFAKISTIEHNLKVRNIGRVLADSIKDMERYVAETLQLTKT
ncbi:hypothetical protein BDV95DRAFT_174912 [Massariosphaeria phaeospora]|uniref:DUF6590 domain-containing protein n=1 Tax=Massariosphaeria phaeospora TaxID=100035 RepID=A0A7C8I4E5_9PLEO|nr:hypothetical protein BDV95DRAFT_174912 [Massariosphaeria phaeospora]